MKTSWKNVLKTILCCVAMMTSLVSCQKAKDNPLKWWQSTIVYEVYPRSFYDTAGTGYGTIKGITEKLAYLHDLGVGALWITPVYKSPMIDGGYDVADYYEIDPSFGSMADMDELIAKAKAQNIRIIMDMVFNHTSDQSKWFQESKKDKTNKYANWYIWRDPAPDGGAPTNWRSIFGGSAWTYSKERNQYYLHTFASAQPDLNWANPEVRKALIDVAKYWVNKGVGGFRLDACTYIKKPKVFVNGKPDATDGLVSIHNMTANQDGILDYLHEFKNEVTKGTDLFVVGEANGVNAADLPLWVGENGVFDMIFEFSHMHVTQGAAEKWIYANKNWQLTDLKQALSATQANTAKNGWCPVFFENHDQPRSINNFIKDEAAKGSPEAAKMLATVLFTLRGTPFVYQGEELGYANIAWPSIDDYEDVNSKPQYDFALQEGFSKAEALQSVWNFSRDNARTPMQWNDGLNAGFTTGKPWLPIHQDYQTYNVKTEKEDPDSVLNYYYKLKDLRLTHPELIKGDYQEILPDNENIYAFTRTFVGKTVVVLANFSNNEVAYDLSILPAESKLLLSSQGNTQKGKLQPLEAVVYEY